MSRLHRIAALLTLTAATSCAGSTQLYPGPRRPEKEVSVLFEDKAQEFGAGVTIARVDSQDAKKGMLKKVIAMLPGDHEVEASLDAHRGSSTYLSAPQLLRFSTQAGHYYACFGEMDEKQGRWALKVKDVSERLANGGLEGVQDAAGY